MGQRSNFEKKVETLPIKENQKLDIKIKDNLKDDLQIEMELLRLMETYSFEYDLNEKNKVIIIIPLEMQKAELEAFEHELKGLKIETDSFELNNCRASTDSVLRELEEKDPLNGLAV